LWSDSIPPKDHEILLGKRKIYMERIEAGNFDVVMGVLEIVPRSVEGEDY
jgi:hypothetical protein